MLTKEGCERRQERFRAFLASERLDAAIITDHREIYWLTGLLAPAFPSLLYIETEGRSWLATYTADGQALVDDRLTYEYQRLSTNNPDPGRELARTVASRLSGMARPRRLGWQAESLTRLLADAIATGLHPAEWVSIDDGLARLEKRKEQDEVALLQKAIDCSLAAYGAAGAAIAPGCNELDVLESAHRAATLQAGEVIYHGGDYRSGEIGGPARDRPIVAGELYIVDAQSVYRGYNSDLARTFAVGEPTELQVEVYRHLTSILREVPNMVQPGMTGAALWHRLDERIREHPHLQETGLIHHGGHGVGLRPHEAPDINRDRESVFEVGDVFSCEPGAYSPELNAGIRVENSFLLTEDGPTLLSDYPLRLVREA